MLNFDLLFHMMQKYNIILKPTKEKQRKNFAVSVLIRNFAAKSTYLNNLL
jgi:hypothetical protein